MLHVLIMAGGSGTRFWPKSRRNRPKQLIKLFGDRSMLQTTVDRVLPMVPPDRILVVTGEDQAQAVSEQLPEIPPHNIVGEPCPRDTAPCVGLAAALIARRDPESIMVVLSADHLIEPPDAFRAALRAAALEVEKDPGCFVVFGVSPTRPETGYGYIERAEALGATEGIALHRVQQFHEKPDKPTAQRYIDSGRCVWNAGMFVWKTSAVLQALHDHRPDIAQHLDRIASALGTPQEREVMAAEYPLMTKLPIDKAVMEKHPNVKVVEVRFRWSDVGDWRSLAELLPRDQHANAAQGPAHLVDSRETLVVSEDGGLIVTLGVEDLVIVQSAGVTLVARKSGLDKLKGLVEGLEESGLGDHA